MKWNRSPSDSRWAVDLWLHFPGSVSVLWCVSVANHSPTSQRVCGEAASVLAACRGGGESASAASQGATWRVGPGSEPADSLVCGNQRPGCSFVNKGLGSLGGACKMTADGAVACTRGRLHIPPVRPLPPTLGPRRRLSAVCWRIGRSCVQTSPARTCGEPGSQGMTEQQSSVV